jgi:hypothetical protein
MGKVMILDLAMVPLLWEQKQKQQKKQDQK